MLSTPYGSIFFSFGGIMELKDLFWFIGTFVIVYLIYFFLQVFKKKELNKNKVPVELVYLMKKYNLDMSSIKYQNIMQAIALVSAFDIAFAATFVMQFIKNIYLAVFVGAAVLIPLILITFNFIGVYYTKKGKIKDGNKKN